MNVSSRAVSGVGLENQAAETVLMHLTPPELGLELRVFVAVPCRGLSLRRPARFVAACLPRLPWLFQGSSRRGTYLKPLVGVTFHTVYIRIIRLAVVDQDSGTYS